MQHRHQLEATKESLVRALAQVRDEWMRGLWDALSAAAALETLTDAICAIIRQQETL